MIQIDDAGSGSLVGGTIIGGIRIETGDFYYEAIPVEYFQSPYFEHKSYIDYCVGIISNIINDLHIDKTEQIQICQGYIFDKARVFLKNNGYSFESTKITDPLQSIIEETFIDYVIGIGIPLSYIDYTKYPFHFHKLLRWVLADFESRQRTCKTGWKSWKKYCDVKCDIYYDYLYKGSFTCLKCGNYIDTPCKIKVVKFTTNKDYYIYLHSHC